MQRTVSGIVYIILIIGSLFLGKFAFGLVLLLIGILALDEFYRLTDGPGTTILKTVGFIVAGLMISSAFLVFSGIINPVWLSVNLLLYILLYSVALFTNHRNRSDGLAIILLGLIYIALPLALSMYFVFPQSSHHEYTYRIMLGIFILIWVNDVMAYLVGITMGRHRLFERISPKKSWEGAIGGALFTFAAAIWMNDLMNILSQRDWLILAGIVSVFGVLGDLFESMFKRNADLKDSGKLIPGHGGILDRIDSMLFVAPVAFVYLLIQNL